ncbi:hypothetical protein K456DRAFT_43804 [Colletotrichum gloeosporioides 23]|nr:hypothetical protein K456DRAFT_43804 [Colletotrichum gloeosporioides 23]
MSQSSSDENEEIERLKNRLSQLTERKKRKDKARAVVRSLQRRCETTEPIPKRQCGDILPHRYSTEGSPKLRSVPIATFVRLAKFLSKNEIEQLCEHEKSFEDALQQLPNEQEILASWYTLYLLWKKTSPAYAFSFLVDTLKKLHSLQDSPYDLAGERVSGGRQGKRRRVNSASDVSNLPAGETLGECRSTSSESPRSPIDTAVSSCRATAGDSGGSCPARCPNSDVIAPYAAYSIGYVHKLGLARCFSSSFIQQLSTTPNWGMNEITTCVRFHAFADYTEVVADWNGDGLPDVGEIFIQPPIATVRLKQVPQLFIRLSWDEGQKIIQGLGNPDTL